MGLDAYLKGKVKRWPTPTTRGRVAETVYHLGYWRSRRELNNYILTRFGETDFNTNNGRPVRLSKVDLEQTLKDVLAKDVIKTYCVEEQREYVRAFKYALAWLAKGKDSEIRSVYYEADW